MTNSIADLAKDARCFFVIGSNTTEQHPVIGTKVRQAVRKRGAILIVADPRRIDLVDYATLYLPHRPGTDIALLNGIAHVLVEEGLYDRDFVALRTEGFDELRAVLIDYTPARVAEITGVPAADIVKAAHLMAENRPGALLYAMGITQHITGTHNVMACANLQMLLGNMGVPGGGVNPLRGQNNVQGACDMGGLPNVYPAYQVVTNPEVKAKFETAWGVQGLPDKVGMTVTDMVNAMHDKRIRALYVMGEDPLMSDPDLHHAQEALEQLDFLVVQDIFPTATSKIADVILPAPSFAEKDGTFTNTERRVQRVRAAVPPPGEARQEWAVFADLATRMGYPMHYDSAAQIMEEIASVAPSYGGIRYTRLEKGGLQWPCPNTEHPGTPVLHVGKFSRGLGRFMPVEHLPAAELPDAEYPLLLTTGRVLFHYHGGEMSRRSAGLHAHYPEALVEISPEDAQQWGVVDGEPVRVTSRRGEIVAKAWVTERTQPGIVFMAFHFAEAAANWLTHAALDPIAKIPEYKVCAVRVAKA